MKKYYCTLAIVSILLGAYSCKREEVEVVIPEDQKTLIQLTSSAEYALAQPVTKAGFPGDADKPTLIVARLSSTDGTNSYHTRTLMSAKFDSNANANPGDYTTCSAVSFLASDYNRYWDDCFGRKAKLSVYAIAIPGKNDTGLETSLSYNGDDASNVNPKWKKNGEDNIVRWAVTTAQQDAASLATEDLCYSNNIQKADGENPLRYQGRLVYDNGAYPEYQYKAHVDRDGCEQYRHDFYPTLTSGEMQFKLNDQNFTDGPGHFDRGHMIFHHATTRITIDLVGGEGFDYTNSNSFTVKALKDGAPTTVDLLGMNTGGNLDIKTGVWSGYTTTSDTYMICGAKATGSAFGISKTIYSFTAQVLPGYVLNKDEQNVNMFAFNIDDNNYYVPQSLLFNALNTDANKVVSDADGSRKVTVVDGNKITLEQGKNYHFTITVNKTGINAITCTLVDWVDVDASFTAKNAYITFNSLSTDKNDCEHFDLYRILNESATITDPTHTEFDNTNNTLQYMKGYADGYNPALGEKISTEGDGAGVTKNTEITGSDRTVWKTNWFFASNKSFYHFRTVNPGTTITKDEAGDYFEMLSGEVDDDNDYHWGAIYKIDAANLNYNTINGFDSQLAAPVGPTTSTLNIIEQHMMSNVNVFLLTPAAADGSALPESVDLYIPKDGDTPSHPTEVRLTDYSESATVRMGNGLITPSDSRTTETVITVPTDDNGEWGTSDGEKYYLRALNFQFEGVGDRPYYNISNAYTYRVVPQALTVDAKKVGLTVRTPDNNQYYVVEDLSRIKVSKVSGNALKGDYNNFKDGDGIAIDRWLPGYTYNYYFILRKTGIEALTCTIVDWVTVDGDSFDLDLED